MNINYISARQQDCNQIAEWINTVGHGHIEYLFNDLVAGRTPLQHLAFVLQEDEHYTYRNVDLALDGEHIAGFVFSYIADVNVVTADMERILSQDRVTWLRVFSDNQIENSWYINTLAVAEKYQRRGIAKKLLHHASQRALKNGMQCLSLHVYENNTVAINLYESYGFTQEKRMDLTGHSFFKSRNLSANILMKCNL